MALLLTAALHGLLIAAFVLSSREIRRSPLPAYSVELIAAPRAITDAAAAEVAPAATPAPTPAPSARPPVRPSAAAPAPSKAPAAARAEPAAPGATKAAPGAPAVSSPNTNAAPGTGTAPATIRTVGVEFPFEGYLRNLVAQVYRRWHPPSGNTDLESEMLFFVHRDGSITGLQFVKRSGSFAFDLEAQGAVEAASRAGSIGPLPSGFAPDVLPVSFFFSPRSLR
jgi:protein TonB